MKGPLTYLGDGVYAYYDGFGIELRANHHQFPTDRMYLEPKVLENLHNWIEEIKRSQPNENQD